MSTWEDHAPLLEDPDRFGAVLTSDGAIRYLNDYARTYFDASPDRYREKRFWALPWQHSNHTARQLQAKIQTAASGSFTSVEATVPSGTDPVTFELRLRPVRDANDAVTHILVDGHELAERERLEEELQESEELHRVTLNNMTDTVLITNDAGEFTYVCPNVHFIFGYTVEEIYELGTIEALLGQDFGDRVDSETTTVQTNLECTATDKAGDDHTLLVNVRQVAIQGGTKLYSCRDITTRKQREVALSQLQSTSRDLLYTETYPEAAAQITTDATDILPTGNVAVYRLDEAENILYPISVSNTLQTTQGPLPEISLDQASSIATAYLDEQTQHHTGDTNPFPDARPTTPSTPHVAVPLGAHGVLFVTTDAEATFGTLDREIAELLAATTEAAFDRIARENELRERDNRLQTQNQRLTEVNRVSNIIREIDQELVHAESRATIEEAVCSRLTTKDRFSFAWISATDATQQALHPRAWAGTGDGYLDAITLSTADDTDALLEPSVRAAQTRSPVLVENTTAQLRAADWCREAVSRNFHSALAIPLIYDDVLFGTLGVYADSPDAFDEMVQEVFVELGETIAAAINGVQRKEAIQTDTVVQLEYRIDGSRAILSRLADTHGCQLDVEGTVQTSDETTLVFVQVTGAPVETVDATATEFVDVLACDVIRQAEESGLIKLELRGDFISSALSDHGATLRTLSVEPAVVDVVIDVPKSVPAHSIDELVTNHYPAAELRAQRERTQSPAPSGSPGMLREQLTERQREVLQIAYHSGFFAPNRDLDGRDIAAMLGISSTAFYDHVRRAEQNLVGALFEGS